MFRELNFQELDQVAGGALPYGDPGYNSNEGGGWLQGLIDAVSFSGGVYISAQTISDHNAAMSEIQGLISGLTPAQASLYFGSTGSVGQLSSVGISGSTGDPGDVVVTAPYSNNSSFYGGYISSGLYAPDTATSFFTPTDGGVSSNQGNGSSAGANAFADKIVHNNGSTALDAQVAQEAHNIIANEYDKLAASINTGVGVVPGDSTHPDVIVTASMVSSAINSAPIYITDATDIGTVGPNGAATSALDNSTSLNPQMLQAKGSALVSEVGIASLIDHEIAHRVIQEYFPYASLELAGRDANEVDASRLGAQIFNWVQLQGLNFDLQNVPSSIPSNGNNYGRQNFE